MLKDKKELWLALLAIFLITGIYLVISFLLGNFPHSREIFGHSLGMIGLVLMLMTEVLYTLRKNTRSARWGSMLSWLRFHIFTGLVGPYLALLHTAWKFNGLAGLVILLTFIIVLSGFLGRYIYTAIPRNINGMVVEMDALKQEISRAETEYQTWLRDQPQAIQALSERLAADTPATGGMLGVLARVYYDLRYDHHIWKENHRLDAGLKKRAKQLEDLLQHRRQLKFQVQTWTAARQLLSYWHLIHVPLGVALFLTAFIHAAAALYYGTFLH